MASVTMDPALSEGSYMSEADQSYGDMVLMASPVRGEWMQASRTRHTSELLLLYCRACSASYVSTYAIYFHLWVLLKPLHVSLTSLAWSVRLQVRCTAQLPALPRQPS